MKTTLTHWIPSTVETPSGTTVPVKQPTQEVVRLDVEMFKAGGISRFVFWTKGGKSEAIIFTPDTHAQMTRNANKKNEPNLTADGKIKEELL